NPPPKDEYVQLTEWRYDGEGFTTSPHAVDLSASIENGSELPARLKMSVILKSKYARYDGLFTRNGDRWEYDMQKLEELPWAPNREIYSEGLVIEALESRKVGFKKFDLQPFLKSRENGNPPCLFQLEFRVTNQNQETFYGRSRMITVLLGD
ncbi:MAG: hypothetical protein OEM82_15220, partial [Acidobacteriota bacterium]|nr:hypothetical protein [Acidobacteriota bacterium]